MQPNDSDIQILPDNYQSDNFVNLPGQYTFVVPGEDEKAALPSAEELASLKKDDQVNIVLKVGDETPETVSLVLIDTRDELWDGFVISSSSSRNFLAAVPPQLHIRFDPAHVRSFERRER